MNILSLQFIVLMCAAAAVYQIFPKRMRWTVLTAADVIYVLLAQDLMLTAVMAVQITVTYAAACLMEDRNGGLTTLQKKHIMAAAVSFNAAVMILFKEINFFLYPVRLILRTAGAGVSIPFIHWNAPAGLSYYSLIFIAYILDVYWGVSQAERNPGKMILFAAFFPILTSGPFIRYRDISESLYAGNSITYHSMTYGLQRILWGLFKSLVISNRLGVLVGTIYADPAGYPGAYEFLAFVSFVLQLYTNFSGCIDIIIGISQIFGIEMPENFDSPFYSLSISEFWRRWHMTLGLWLKDYVLYPLLKSKRFRELGETAKRKYGKKWGKQAPLFAGLLITWFLIGFWHGGGWNYIWGCGIYYGILIILGEMCGPALLRVNERLGINSSSRGWIAFQRIRTFLIFTAGLSFFRSYDGLICGLKRWGYALSVWNPGIFFDGSICRLGLDRYDIAVLAVSLAILWIVDVIGHKRSVRDTLAEQNIVIRWGLLLALIFVVIIFGQYGSTYNASSFIYGKF